jgi:hypothetical protein
LRYSKISLSIGILFLILSGTVFYPRWNHGGGEAQLSWDAGGYYWYLPSAFIYHDLKGQTFKDSILEKYAPTPPNDFQYASQPDKGRSYVMKYTMGTALLESPFFFVAHLTAKPLGYPADGFSVPYQFMIYFGGLIFALLGLWHLRKLLLLYFNDKVVAITLLLLVIGTNYLNYAGIDVGMTHTWLFTLYVFILLNTHYFYQTLQSKYILRLGGLIGLIALVRPPEIIAVLIPLLWGLNKISLPILKERILLFQNHWKALFTAAFITIGILSFQFIYWKTVSGHWFVYTYQNQGFSWLKPHLKQYALNYQCGWLVYTPTMFFALFGLIIYIKKGANKVAIISLILFNYYIVAAWDAWDYGGRAMIQNYPVLLFPLAIMIQNIMSKQWKRMVFIPLLMMCIYFNIWFTYQAHGGGLIGSVPATSSYYWHTIFRYNMPIEIQKLRDNKDAYDNPVLHADTLLKGGINAIIVNGIQDSISFNKPVNTYKWIRASANFHVNQKEWNVWYMTQFIIRFKKGKSVLQENNIRIQRLMNACETKNITIDAKVRNSDFDMIEILIRNDNKGILACTINNLQVIGF